MFSAKDTGNASHYDTLISAKTEVEGDVRFSGGLHLDGVIKGNLIAESGSGAVVRISDKGRVEGDIRSPNVIINGIVNGDVHSGEYIELAAKAQINGDIFYHTMEMVLGAQVNGRMQHQADEPAPGRKADNAADQ